MSKKQSTGPHPDSTPAKVLGLFVAIIVVIMVIGSFVYGSVNGYKAENNALKRQIEKLQGALPVRMVEYPEKEKVEQDTLKIATIVLYDNYSEDVSILRLSTYNEDTAIKTLKGLLPDSTKVTIIHGSEKSYTKDKNPDL